MLRQVKGNLLRNGKKRTDLFLIYPPWAALGRDTYLQNFLPPLGILTIAAYAESKGYSAHVFDIHGERADDLELRRRLRLTRPRFIGISVLTNMCVPAHKIAKICKEEINGVGSHKSACKMLVYKRTVLVELILIILLAKTIAIIEPIANVAITNPMPKYSVLI